MGGAIAQRLMSVGHTVSVWNRTAAKTKPVAERGATVAPSRRDLVHASEVIITILTDAAAIEATYQGEEGLLSSDVRGKLFIEMSTVRPEAIEKLAQAVKAQGAAI